MSKRNMTDLTFEQYRIARTAREALTALRETVPSTTVNFAVDDARHALETLIEQCSTIKTHDAKREQSRSTFKRGDRVLVTEPDTNRTYRGRVEHARPDGSLYIEGPEIDSRSLCWVLSAERVAECVRRAEEGD